MNKELDLEVLASQLAYAQDAVKELQEKLEEAKKEAQQPWEPKGGDWPVRSDGTIVFNSNTYSPDHGCEFKTKGSAKHTAPWFRFYHRLCQLAIDLNSSGKVGGDFGVYFTGRWGYQKYIPCSNITCVFETQEAAKQAADILNRDEWRLPQ